MGKEKDWEELVAAGFTAFQAEALMKVFKKGKTVAPKENLEVWEAYRSAYFQRYKKDPVRNASVNKQVAELVKRLGADAVEVVRFYLEHNKGYYVERCHPISGCLTDAEALHTQWVRGKAITRNDVRQFEKTDSFRSQMERIERGEL